MFLILNLTLAFSDWLSDASHYSPELNVHLPSRISTNNIIFVKSINTKFSEEEIALYIPNSLKAQCTVKRLDNNKSLQPIPVIKISFEDYSDVKNCISNRIYILECHKMF